MKKIKSIIAVMALTLTAFLVSCSSETFKELASSIGGGGKSNVVTFQLESGNKSMTRAEGEDYDTGVPLGSIAGFDRENAINFDKLYVVVFKLNADGQTYSWYKTFKKDGTNGTAITKTAGATVADDRYQFVMGDGGVYYMYVIANAETDLTTLDIPALATAGGISEREAFYRQLENLDKSAYVAGGTSKLNEVTDLLMTSNQIQVNIKGDEETELPTITLTRAIARIDIDASAMPDNFRIDKVKFENRHNNTYLIRGALAEDMTDVNLTKDYDDGATNTPKEYARANVKIDVTPASPGPPATPATSNYEGTMDNIWNGVIYSCENYDTSAGNQTVLTVEGTYTSGDRQGITVSHEIDFGTMQIKRNYLYKVRIALEDPAGDTYGKVTHAINVKNWTSGVTLAWAGDENLYKNDAVANYTVTDASGEYTLAGVKHYIVLPYNDDHFATFHVESTSTKSGMSLTCAAEAIPATEGGYQVEISRLPEEYVYREDGTFTQKWEVKVKESALPLAEIGTTLEFKLQNAMASANSTSFKITGVQPSMPSFSLLANGASGSNTSANVFATTNENPTTIYAVPLDGTVSLEVETKGGAILEILDGSQWTNATNSITLSGSDLAADNQSFVQKVDFTLNTTRGKLTKFRLKNAATPDDETLWRTFTLNAMKIPLEYMAQGVIKNGSADADGSWEQDYTQTQGWIFSRTNMLSYFDGGFTSYYYKDGTKYTSSCHVPTLEEWHGIVSGAAIDFQDLRNSTSNYTSQTADICGLHLTGFTDTYSQTGNGSASTDADIIYAIRFVDAQWEGQPTASNLWKIAYRYTLMGTKLWTKIESVYLGPNDATTIDNIKNASWWSGKTIVTRLMPWYPISSEGAKSKTNSNCVGECHSIDNELQGYCSGNAHLSSYYANYSSNNLVMPFTDE